MWLDGVQDLTCMANGILAGLVSITAPCSAGALQRNGLLRLFLFDRCECCAVEPWAAIVIGMIGGLVYYLGVKLLDWIQIDDVVLAIPVHCFW